MKYKVGQRVKVRGMGNATILHVNEDGGILAGFHSLGFSGHDGSCASREILAKYKDRCWWISKYDIEDFIDNELEFRAEDY
jgi:hypothetical protein